MESFQRKPKGGNSSSAADAQDTARKKATNLLGRICLIARLPLKLTTQFDSRSSFFATGRIRSSPVRPSEGGKIARAHQFRQLTVPSPDFQSLLRARRIDFVIWATLGLIFSQDFFCCDKK
jgi:hypothetical protein